MSGVLRYRIMAECPAEFEDELKTFIDEVEERVNKIASKMNVALIHESDELTKALELTEDLSTDLY